MGSISFSKQTSFCFVDIMQYMRFARFHPVLFTSIILFLFFPIWILFSYYQFNLNIWISILVGFSIAIIFALFCGIFMLYQFKNPEFKRFVNNLDEKVKKKRDVSGLNTIATEDFGSLKILYFKPMKKYKSENRLYSSKGTWKAADRTGDALTEKGTKMYNTSYEGNFSFEFIIAKENVKIDVPSFNYFRSLSSAMNNFKDWKNEYPSLGVIIEKLPEWIKRIEIFYQENTVFVTIWAGRDFCLNNSLDVYNELVNIKRDLTK